MQAKGVGPVGVGCTARENTQWQLLPLLVYLTSADPLPSRLGVNSSGDTVSSGAGLRRVSTGMANGALVLIKCLYILYNKRRQPIPYALKLFADETFAVFAVQELIRE